MKNNVKILQEALEKLTGKKVILKEEKKDQYFIIKGGDKFEDEDEDEIEEIKKQIDKDKEKVISFLQSLGLKSYKIKEYSNSDSKKFQFTVDISNNKTYQDIEVLRKISNEGILKYCTLFYNNKFIEQ